MTPKQFKTYLWMVDIIKNRPGITFSELREAWEKDMILGEKSSLDRRTFIRYRNELEFLFGLDIICDIRNGYGYYLGNEHVINDNSVGRWMMTALSIGLKIVENVSLHDRIILEDVPSGEKWLMLITDAMKSNKRLLVNYRKYDDVEGRQFLLSPYCLKIYNRRWYLLGQLDNGKLYTFALDRMQEVKVTDEQFAMDKDFNGKEYFNDMYGIVRFENREKQRIVIRTYGNEHHYLRNLPLHHSQREVCRGDDFVDFEYLMHPTMELSGYILSRGKRMCVVYPRNYAQEIAAMKGDF